MPTEPAIGATIAGCRIEALLARGGMGVVYRATELALHRPVALKLIVGDQAENPEFRARFEREARLTAAIDHPNVIPVYGAGEEDGLLYLIMRLVEGVDLRAAIAQVGQVDPARLAPVISQTAAALDAAHAAGLLHRDIKPANVLLATGSRPEHVYLTDFGVGRAIDSSTRMTDSGALVGTADFMAPEQLRGEPIDARTDIYALGCLLVVGLTGAPPYRRDGVAAVITAHLHDEPPRVAGELGLPDAVDTVIARVLAKQPSDRYPTAGALAEAFASAIDAAPTDEAAARVVTAWPAGEDATRVVSVPAAQDATRVTSIPAAHDATRVIAGPPPPSPARRRPRTLLALAALAAVAVGGVLLAQGRGEKARAADSGPLTEAHVRGVAERFADAYATEDAAALARVLTPDAKRVTPGEQQRGRAMVLAEYRQQFRASEISGYELDDVEVRAGRAGRVAGRYTVTRAGTNDITGTIVFGVRRERGQPRIALIAAEPDA